MARLLVGAACLTVLGIFAKVLGLIDWPWLVILAPTWAPLAFLILVLTLFIACSVIGGGGVLLWIIWKHECKERAMRKRCHDHDNS